MIEAGDLFLEVFNPLEAAFMSILCISINPSALIGVN